MSSLRWKVRVFVFVCLVDCLNEWCLQVSGETGPLSTGSFVSVCFVLNFCFCSAWMLCTIRLFVRSLLASSTTCFWQLLPGCWSKGFTSTWCWSRYMPETTVKTMENVRGHFAAFLTFKAKNQCHFFISLFETLQFWFLRNFCRINQFWAIYVTQG